MMRFVFAAMLIFSLLFYGCTTHVPAPAEAAAAPKADSVLAVHVAADSMTFAVIGDYGADTKQEDSVAQMVKSWHPDFIITVGDNNYYEGSAETIKDHIGKYYCDYIYNPDARPDWQCHGRAAQEKQNRFFPAPGNHDNYSTPPLKPYLDYFTLPGDERNYDFTWGPMHFYSINSDTTGELKQTGKEAQWLHAALAKDSSTFKIVYFHHPPFSAGAHGSSVDMRWPYHDWGIDAVLGGHEHFYAHAKVRDTPSPIYLICGSSGTNEHYGCNDHPLDKAKYDWFCDNVHFGAIRVHVTAHRAVFEYYAVEDPTRPIDVNVINK
jgi:tartrate-resistant acid phosphatase type 5